VATPGTHIKVRRRDPVLGLLPYEHHGICLSACEVIEFGGSKPRTYVRRVSLEDFRKGETVGTVHHPVRWMWLTYSPLLPPEEVIDRAEWLLANQPPSYQLGYRNCESIALWCATGDFESFQVKKFMLGKIPLSMATLMLLNKKPSVGKWLAVAAVGSSLLTAVPYVHDRVFFDHTRRYPGIGNWKPIE
jgi:hypothetical protein